MRRWNGWGDDGYHHPLPGIAEKFLTHALAPIPQQPDAALQDGLALVPASRLPADPGYTIEPLDRLLHARGQSLPDWIALRSGRLGCYPDAVAYPQSTDEVTSLLKMSAQKLITLIPFGGGTSVTGHINPLPDERPILTVDLSKMNRMIDLDENSRLAVFQSGATGPQIESQLKQYGYTLGHYPQSFEYSTIGGWVAARSCGQQSAYYGRIEDLFAGGSLDTFEGRVELPPFPASAAGPDLRHLVLGSEGRLGILTQAALRIRPLPETEGFYAILFHDWESGAAALRLIAQEKAGISMLRLSDSQETQVTLLLSGKERLVAWAQRAVSVLGYANSPSLLVFAVTGPSSTARAAHRRIRAEARRCGGLYTGSQVGNMWRKSRFTTPYLRNTLWEHGFALDTIETAATWSHLLSAAEAIKLSISRALDAINIPSLVFAHISSVYSSGASIYVTYIFPHAADPGENLARWQVAKSAASQAIRAAGGTISHQHGVGLDHARYLTGEKSPPGISMLHSVLRSLDPQGLLNPGKLLDESPHEPASSPSLVG